MGEYLSLLNVVNVVGRDPCEQLRRRAGELGIEIVHAYPGGWSSETSRIVLIFAASPLSAKQEMLLSDPTWVELETRSASARDECQGVLSRTDAWAHRMAWALAPRRHREGIVGDILSDRAYLRKLGVPERDINLLHTGFDLAWLAMKRVMQWGWVVLKWAGLLAAATIVAEAAKAVWKSAH